METQALLEQLNQGGELQLREVITIEELETALAERVNTLIQKDFNRLLQLLYRVDVDEARLKRLLRENTGEDAGRIIAKLILERQWQKILTRRQYRKGD